MIRTLLSPRAIGAVLVALAVNTLLLLGLAWLNKPATLAANPRPVLRVSLQLETTTPQVTLPDDTPPQPQEPLDPPVAELPPEAFTPRVSPLTALDPVALLDIDIALDIPAVSPVQVNVKREQGEPAAVIPVPVPVHGPSKPSPATEPMELGQVDQPPRERVGNPRPSYPRIAARRGIEGHVSVRLLIDEAGRVQDVELLEVQGHRAFGDAVLDVARRWRFEPAVHDGVPISVVGTKRIRFKLE